MNTICKLSFLVTSFHFVISFYFVDFWLFMVQFELKELLLPNTAIYTQNIEDMEIVASGLCKGRWK